LLAHGCIFSTPCQAASRVNGAGKALIEREVGERAQGMRGMRYPPRQVGESKKSNFETANWLFAGCGCIKLQPDPIDLKKRLPENLRGVDTEQVLEWTDMAQKYNWAAQCQYNHSGIKKAHLRGKISPAVADRCFLMPSFDLFLLADLSCSSMISWGLASLLWLHLLRFLPVLQAMSRDGPSATVRIAGSLGKASTGTRFHEGSGRRIRSGA
jgi:hypothetical protein